MFLHGGRDHILGNILFLAIFGKNIEDAFGSLAYLVFHFAATMTQTAMTLLFDPAQDAGCRNGASGAVAVVLGAHFVLYPSSQSSRTSSSLARRSSPTSAGSSSACWQHGSLPGGTGSTQGAMALHGAARGILAATGETGRPLRTCAPTPDRV